MILQRLVILIASVCASGCTLFAGELDKAADGAGRLVKFYCENVTVPEIREEFRLAVNAQPHSVSVQCAQGGVPLVITPSSAPPLN